MKVRSTIHLRRSLCEPWSPIFYDDTDNLDRARSALTSALRDQVQADGPAQRELMAAIWVWPAGAPNWQRIGWRRVIGRETIERQNL